MSGVFRIHDLLTTPERRMPTGGVIDLRLLDETSDGESDLLHDTGLVGVDLAPAYRYEKRLKPVGGRQWSLIATPSTTYISAQRTIIPYLSFLAGCLITGWLSYYLLRLTEDKKSMEHQVDARTQELRTQSAALTKSNSNLNREITERRLLQKQYANVTDHEQRRLGQELHDSLGQQIAVTAILAESLQQRFASAQLPEAKYLDRLLESAQTAQAQVRALSKGLLPVEIDSGGVKTALKELAASTRGVSDSV